MKISTRQLTFALVALVVVLAAWSLLGLLVINDATLEAMSPGDPAAKRWRIVGIQLLVASVVTGVLAFDRLRRGKETMSLLAPSCAVLAALGIWAAARMTGINRAFQVPIIFCVAVAGVASWMVRRDQASGSDPRYVTVEDTTIWLAAILQAAAWYFLLALGGERSLPERPLRAFLLTSPQWIVAWRFGAASRLSRWDAGAATTLGVVGVVMLVLVSIFPMAYVGFLGLVLLRSPWGVAFYAALGTGTWLFLRAGTSLRSDLAAPPRDRLLAILAGVFGVPALVTLSLVLWRLVR